MSTNLSVYSVSPYIYGVNELNEDLWRGNVLSSRKHWLDALQEGITPLSETAIAVTLLFGICSTSVLEPITEKLLIFLKH